MKKLLSILLVAVFAISLTGAALADDKPVEILFWTTRASGAQATVVNHEVDTFNETIGKEKGIHITHEAQAGYPEIWAAFSTAAGSVAPDVVALGNTYIPYALDEGMLADVTGMEGADALRANLMDWVLDIAGNKDDELHSFPYIRSTPVLYYNKDIADELGITIPEQARPLSMTPTASPPATASSCCRTSAITTPPGSISWVPSSWRPRAALPPWRTERCCAC